MPFPASGKLLIVGKPGIGHFQNAETTRAHEVCNTDLNEIKQRLEVRANQSRSFLARKRLGSHAPAHRRQFTLVSLLY